MNTFQFVRCLKNDVQVHLMFDEMVFDTFFYLSCMFIILSDEFLSFYLLG